MVATGGGSAALGSDELQAARDRVRRAARFLRAKVALDQARYDLGFGEPVGAAVQCELLLDLRRQFDGQGHGAKTLSAGIRS